MTTTVMHLTCGIGKRGVCLYMRVACVEDCAARFGMKRSFDVAVQSGHVRV